MGRLVGLVDLCPILVPEMDVKGTFFLFLHPILVLPFMLIAVERLEGDCRKEYMSMRWLRNVFDV